MSRIKEPTKRSFLNQTEKISYRTILDPRVFAEISGRDKRPIRLTDYIAVPRLATFGTFTLEEMARFTPARKR